MVHISTIRTTDVTQRDKYLEQSEQDFYYYYHLIGVPILSLPVCLQLHLREMCVVSRLLQQPHAIRLPAAEYSKCI